MKHYNIPFSALSISVDSILKEMGYRDNKPELYIVSQIEELLNGLESTVNAQGAFGLYDGKLTEDTLLIASAIPMKTGKTINGLLKGSFSYAVFVATAGKEFEEFRIKTEKEDDILKTFLLDVIGSCIAEGAGDYLESEIEKEIKDLQHTNRFSPGYCGWPLTDQKKIFSLVDGATCGIELTDVCLMYPIKSISGIVGIGHEVKKKQYACDVCEMETCYKRNLRNNKQYGKLT